MKFTILLKSEDDSSAPLMVSQIERTGPLNAATLGQTLAESKCLLANVQQELVESQAQCCCQGQRICTRCGTRRTLKDYHIVCFKSLFGGVRTPAFFHKDVALGNDDPPPAWQARQRARRIQAAVYRRGSLRVSRCRKPACNMRRWAFSGQRPFRHLAASRSCLVSSPCS